MENNIFIKNNKDKYNPDVLIQLSKKNSERSRDAFKTSNIVYNPITNNIPSNISSIRDLQLKQDEPVDNVNKLLMKLKDERSHNYFIPKQKVLYDNESDKPIQDFNDMKVSSEKYLKDIQSQYNMDKNKYNNILLNLKNLGILK
jgi:hypothetical protein